MSEQIPGLTAIREIADNEFDRYGRPVRDQEISSRQAREVLAILDQKDAEIDRLRRLIFDAVTFAARNQEWLDAAYDALVGNIPVNKIVGGHPGMIMVRKSDLPEDFQHFFDGMVEQ